VIGVDRAVIEEQSIQGVTHYKLQIDGDNLRDVLATPGIRGTKTVSNNIWQVFSTLGIEAAR